MTLIRKLVFITMKYNFQFKALHVAGSSNEIADALSRFQQDRFFALAPSADPASAEIPLEFWSIISAVT